MIIENRNGLTILYAEGTSKITNKKRTMFSDCIYLAKNDKVENYEEVPRDIWRIFVKDDAKIDDDTIQTYTVSGSLTLSDKPYQKVIAKGDLTIALPQTIEGNIMVIHLLYTTDEIYALTLEDEVQWQTIPEIKVGAITEFVFTWDGSQWLANGI